MPPVARTHTIPPPTPELLTESFCERCGTRYTFESAAPKARRPGLGRARVLTRGLKNWVVEDGRSIEAAMADARRDEERTLASAQLEAFHQTFNFCMDCRQYTCTDCWNQPEGRCLSCAPMPGQLEAEAAAAAAAAAAAHQAAAAGATTTNGVEPGAAWPTVDLTGDEAAEATAAEPAVTAATPYMPTDLRPVELPDDDVETMIGTTDMVEATAVAEVTTRTEAADEADEAVETGPPMAVEAEAPSGVEPVALAAASAAVAEPEVEITRPVEVTPQAEPEPMAAEAPVGPAAPEPEPMAAEAPVEPAAPEPDLVPSAPPPIAPPPAPAPAWTIVAPDVPSETPAAPPAWPPRAPVYQPPAKAPAPQAPAVGQPGQPAWPALPPAAFTVPAAQAVWEESSLGVISRPGSGVQACVSCGLPLSATARFCRRCGSRQG